MGLTEAASRVRERRDRLVGRRDELLAQEADGRMQLSLVGPLAPYDFVGVS